MGHANTAARDTAATSAHAVADRPARKQAERTVVARTSGRRHGPVTRVVSPGDIGELIKPYIFLDYFDFIPQGGPMFPMHPHSGIATITILLSGDMRYEDTTGAAGQLAAGSVEWMRAGNGVYHDAGPAGGSRFQGYQMWVALSPELENGPAHSQYLPAASVPSVGPARVILGSYAGRTSEVAAPSGMTTLHVRLRAGETWTFEPPAGHTVAWAHACSGVLRVAGTKFTRELVAFSESEDAIEFVAQDDAEFIVASAVRHPYPLVTGYYSVHTSEEALLKGETEIARIGQTLRSQGRLR